MLCLRTSKTILLIYISSHHGPIRYKGETRKSPELFSPRRRRCDCCLPGGLQGKAKEKEGVADPRPIVTTPSVCDNWGVDDGRLNNSGLFLFFPLYLIGP